MKIWLDDEREAPEGWVRAHTVPELLKLLRDNHVEELSLDHDLGEGEMTGYDFMRWLEAQVFSGRMQNIPQIKIHSANPVGVRNMYMSLQSIQRMLKRS